MNFDFWAWFGTLNLTGRISMIILGGSLAILAIVGVYYLIKAIIKGIAKGSKEAVKGLTRGIEKARAKINAKKPEIKAKLEMARQKISVALATVKQKLDTALNGVPPMSVAPVTPESPTGTSTPAPEIVANGVTVAETKNPSVEEAVAPSNSYEFSTETLPQYCVHCGAPFRDTMNSRVSHDLPTFCGCCGMKFTPNTGTSYQKLVNEVLQP